MSIMSDVHELLSIIKASVSSSVADLTAQSSPTTTSNELAEKQGMMNKALAERFLISHVKSYAEKRYDELKDQLVSLSVDLTDTNVSVLPGTRHVVYEDEQFFYQVNVKRGGTRLDTTKLKLALTRRGLTASEVDAIVAESSNTSAPQIVHEIIPK